MPPAHDPTRRRMVLTAMSLPLAAIGLGGRAQAAAHPRDALTTWYRLVLELVRHTATYSPPVASRSFALLGIVAYEAMAHGRPDMPSLAGQLADLPAMPAIDPASVQGPDRAVLLHGALSQAVAALFANTGPTGQRAMAAMRRQLDGSVAQGLDADTSRRRMEQGAALAGHILKWAEGDGGAVIANMGFPYSYTPVEGPDQWVPTSAIVQQQAPLLPDWGSNRPFAMPDGAACPLPPPPAYGDTPGSAFYAEAMEVYDVTRNLTDEQRLIARFWSDDPMLSPTPPGHWISIALQIILRDEIPADRAATILAQVGMAVADGFIACWNSKFRYNLLRPVTYIKRHIDKDWMPLLITPPFPEYPSGHSTQSAAAAAVLTAAFGPGFAFTDETHVAEGLPARSYADFWAAAEEAAISRLYGGIHFRAAIERGLDQGRCVGGHVLALRMGA